MAFIEEHVRTVKTYTLSLSEEEIKILHKLLGEDEPGNTGRGYTTSFSMYEDFCKILGELNS